MKDKHIGSLIHKKVEEKGLQINDFAEALHCHRSNVYSIFGRNNIDLNLLTSISEILGCDLLNLYLEDENRRKNYIALIEVDESKMNELLSDDSFKIIQSWQVSK
jgi:transcriptional regulator with XRE-family HTH domain